MPLLGIGIGILFFRYGIVHFTEKRINTVIDSGLSNNTNIAFFAISVLLASIAQLNSHQINRAKYYLGFKHPASEEEVKRFIDKEPKPSSTLFIAVVFTCFLPGRSYLTGAENARRIKENKEFDYIVSDSLGNNQKSIYKYLGKAGDYHLLMPLNNTKRIIVPFDKISPLTLENFSLDDPSSIKRFRILNRLLTKPLQPSSVTLIQKSPVN
jgi:hypothetical protein